MLNEEEYKFVKKTEEEIRNWINTYKETFIKDGEKKVSIFTYLQKPEVDIQKLKEMGIAVPESDYIQEEIEINVKYDGYLEREEKLNEKMKYLEGIKIPEDIDYSQVAGLRKEIVQKLTKFRPMTLGQASRLEGITPAAITALLVHIEKMREKRKTG
jgi:tRNA uridine 5-carboxymethylaminomethyl modification enzyme